MPLKDVPKKNDEHSTLKIWYNQNSSMHVGGPIKFIEILKFIKINFQTIHSALRDVISARQRWFVARLNCSWNYLASILKGFYLKWIFYFTTYNCFLNRATD